MMYSSVNRVPGDEWSNSHSDAKLFIKYNNNNAFLDKIVLVSGEKFLHFIQLMWLIDRHAAW